MTMLPRQLKRASMSKGSKPMQERRGKKRTALSRFSPVVEIPIIEVPISEIVRDKKQRDEEAQRKREQERQRIEIPDRDPYGMPDGWKQPPEKKEERGVLIIEL